MIRHRGIATERYDSTSRMLIHKRGSTFGRVALTETDQLLPLPRRATAANTPVRDRRPSTSAAVNLPPSREKFWAPRKRRQRPDRSGRSQHRRRDGRIVPSVERLLQGTPLPDKLCDHLGREFEPSEQL